MQCMGKSNNEIAPVMFAETWPPLGGMGVKRRQVKTANKTNSKLQRSLI